MQHTLIENVFFFLLVFLILGVWFRCLFCKDKAMQFHPIVFLCLYLSYYVVLPYTELTHDVYTGKPLVGVDKLLLGTILMIISFLVALQLNIKRTYFNKTIKVFSGPNLFQIGVILFCIGFFAHVFISGFNFSFLTVRDVEQIGEFDEMASYNHVDMYIGYLVSLFPVSIAIFFSERKKKYLVLTIIISSIIYLIGGFRFRLLLLAVSFFVTIHLIPRKRINFKIWLPLLLLFYISMGIVESTRTYGGGLDLARINDLLEGNVSFKKAGESALVYGFSAQAMEVYDNNGFIYFEPVITAVCMPLPRSVFPWKPDGSYVRKANMAVYETITIGNAYINVTEAYGSFGWLGVIIYGLVLGYMANIFWSTYKRNQNSLAAIILLSLFNGMLFVFVSRGYMAQGLTFYVYYLLVFCWFSRMINNFLNRRIKKSQLVV